MIRTVLCFVVMLSALPNATAATESAAATMSEADVQAERSLLAVGGRSAWASVSNTIMYSDQYRQGDPTVGVVSTMDYRRLRLRIDITSPGLQQVRVIDGESDRTLRFDQQASGPENSAEDALARDLRRYTGHVYLTLRRIAVGDPNLRLDIGRKGSLDVYEGSGRIAWYLLDARGEPYAMGAHDDNVGVICGPWELAKSGIRYPLWVSRPDGTWRAVLKSLVVNVRVDDELFTLPLAADQ